MVEGPLLAAKFREDPFDCFASYQANQAVAPPADTDPLDLLQGHLASCCDGSMCVELLSHDSTPNKLRPMWAPKEVSHLSSPAAMRHQSVRASNLLVQPSLRVPPSALTPVSALRDIASLPCVVSLYLLVAASSCTSSVFHELDAP